LLLPRRVSERLLGCKANPKGWDPSFLFPEGHTLSAPRPPEGYTYGAPRHPPYPRGYTSSVPRCPRGSLGGSLPRVRERRLSWRWRMKNTKLGFGDSSRA
jgi:hypothetical protein